MGIINVRVDDHIHEELKLLAEAEGYSLSEYVRRLLLEATVPVRDGSHRHGDLPAPDTLSTKDRLILSTLHRILARVLPEDATGEDGDAEYQLTKAEILEKGFVGEYWLEVAGMETELSKQDSERVIDILQMFRIITFSIDRLARGGSPLPDDLVHSLRFRGFDHNDSLEGHMARYVRFMMRDGDKWQELQAQIDEADRGNSHMQMLGHYLRMLHEYRKIMDNREKRYTSDAYFLGADDLTRLAAV